MDGVGEVGVGADVGAGVTAGGIPGAVGVCGVTLSCPEGVILCAPGGVVGVEGGIGAPGTALVMVAGGSLF